MKAITKEIEYPCLMINRNSSNIILFSEYGKGIMVKVVDPWGFSNNRKIFRTIGYYCSNWWMKNYIPFNGILELSN